MLSLVSATQQLNLDREKDASTELDTLPHVRLKTALQSILFTKICQNGVIF